MTPPSLSEQKDAIRAALVDATNRELRLSGGGNLASAMVAARAGRKVRDSMPCAATTCPARRAGTPRLAGVGDSAVGVDVMSTFSHTDWTVICDYPDCPRQLTTDDLGMSDPTAAGVRKVLRRRGWAIAVFTGREKRADFCPAHKDSADSLMGRADR